MRFPKLALASLTAVAVAAFGVSALAQQPAAPAQPAPAAEQPAAATAAEGPAAPEAPGTTAAPTTEAPAAQPSATPAAVDAGEGHGEEAGGGEAHASGGDHHLLEPKGGWPHEGYFGTFDQNQLQRGFKVYTEVCSVCHGMKLLSYRNLGEPGAPFYDPRYPNPNDNPVVKQIAATFNNQIPTIDPDSGDMVMMPAKTSDNILGPFANDTAARLGNGGALPPDLSVITKARHGGAGYIYSLLMGYVPPPEGLTVAPGQHYNAYFAGDTTSSWAGDPREKPPGGFLAMASPLEFADVTFDDGTATTQEQMAHDVAAFLAWAGDPKAVARKQMGAVVIPYLLILALLVFLSYRRLWRNVEH
jgi:ubiquinol-cytochrome c reductase cytochrome c1 subunit